METTDNNDNHPQPNAYRVEDDNNLEEKDLRRKIFVFGEEEKKSNTVDEIGQEHGGHNFGKDNNTPSGDDANNPSRNAGYSNKYYKRTEPAEEHPEFNNFKDPNQLGEPNFTQSSVTAPIDQSDEGNGVDRQEDAGNGNSNDQNLSYQEGTADNDGYKNR